MARMGSNARKRAAAIKAIARERNKLAHLASDGVRDYVAGAVDGCGPRGLSARADLRLSTHRETYWDKRAIESHDKAFLPKGR